LSACYSEEGCAEIGDLVNNFFGACSVNLVCNSLCACGYAVDAVAVTCEGASPWNNEQGTFTFQRYFSKSMLIMKKQAFEYLTVHISQRFLGVKEGLAEFLNLKDSFLICVILNG
jgi:hypothetical protein